MPLWRAKSCADGGMVFGGETMIIWDWKPWGLAWWMNHVLLASRRVSSCQATMLMPVYQRCCWLQETLIAMQQQNDTIQQQNEYFQTEVLRRLSEQQQHLMQQPVGQSSPQQTAAQMQQSQMLQQQLQQYENFQTEVMRRLSDVGADSPPLDTTAVRKDVHSKEKKVSPSFCKLNISKWLKRPSIIKQKMQKCTTAKPRKAPSSLRNTIEMTVAATLKNKETASSSVYYWSGTFVFSWGGYVMLFLHIYIYIHIVYRYSIFFPYDGMARRWRASLSIVLKSLFALHKSASSRCAMYLKFKHITWVLTWALSWVLETASLARQLTRSVTVCEHKSVKFRLAAVGSQVQRAPPCRHGRTDTLVWLRLICSCYQNKLHYYQQLHSG